MLKSRVSDFTKNTDISDMNSSSTYLMLSNQQVGSCRVENSRVVILHVQITTGKTNHPRLNTRLPRPACLHTA